MSKSSLFLFGIILSAVCFFAGCSDPEKEKAEANIALRNEVKEILEAIQPVHKGFLTSEERSDIVNSDIIITLDKYKRLCELTGLMFYSWVLSESNNNPFFTNEQFQKLTENNPKLIPFFVEDEVSGTLYFAPPPEQEFIISKYKNWFAKNGETFDFHALQQKRNKTE